MPDFAIEISDPLGIGTLDGSNGINVVDISGGDRNDFHEVLAGNGKFIESAVQVLRPREEWSIEYELLTGGSFSLAFGAAVNTDYLVTSFSANTSPDVRPTVSVTVVKPSSAAKIKAYFGSAISQALTGGFGIIEKWGCTSTAAFTSSSGTITMQTAESMEETSGDYLDGGILHYGFKKEVSVEAYATLTLPGTAHQPTGDIRRSRDGWKVFAASFWQYMDAA